jgi:hypothetical protein
MIMETGTNMLAETMISGEWIIAMITTLGVAIGGVIKAYKVGEAKGRGDKVTLQEPVPEVPIRKVFTPPTFTQHQDLMRRVDVLEKGTQAHREYVEGQFRDIRREGSEQFIKLMNAGETRKDAIMEEVRKEMGRIYDRLNKLSEQLK